VGRITLDHSTFKVLASDTRLAIIKELDKTQLTVSDMARRLGMNKATLYEHLMKLIECDIVSRDDARKWVYYSLTWKGKKILHPDRVQFNLFLSLLAVVGMAIILLLTTAPTVEPNDGDDVYQAVSVDAPLPPDIFINSAQPRAPTSGVSWVMMDLDTNVAKLDREPLLLLGEDVDPDSIRVSFVVSQGTDSDDDMLDVPGIPLLIISTVMGDNRLPDGPASQFEELDIEVDGDQVLTSLNDLSPLYLGGSTIIFRLQYMTNDGEEVTETHTSEVRRTDHLNLNLDPATSFVEGSPDGLTLDLGFSLRDMDRRIIRTGQVFEFSVFSEDPGIDHPAHKSEVPIVTQRSMLESGMGDTSLFIDSRYITGKELYIYVDQDDDYAESNELDNIYSFIVPQESRPQPEISQATGSIGEDTIFEDSHEELPGPGAFLTLLVIVVPAILLRRR